MKDAAGDGDRSGGGGKSLRFALVATLLFFLALETALRLTGADRVGEEEFYRNIFDPLTLPIPGTTNPYSDIVEFMNKGGFRGPDFGRAKPEDTFRIVCLGDSTTFSLGRYEESYPYLLEKILNEGRPSKRIEVINAGVPGTNIYQQRLLFERLFAGTDPDMVLLMSGPNCRGDLKDYRDRMKKPHRAILRRVNLALYHLALYRVAMRILKGGVSEEVRDDSRANS
ncbi:unnamed protein product, partial [marine sediment metagenome]